RLRRRLRRFGGGRRLGRFLRLLGLRRRFLLFRGGACRHEGQSQREDPEISFHLFPLKLVVDQESASGLREFCHTCEREAKPRSTSLRKFLSSSSSSPATQTCDTCSRP